MAAEGQVSIDGQNVRISKHSAAGRVAGSIPVGALWPLRVRSVWVARMQGFPSILRREGWEEAREEGEEEEGRKERRVHIKTRTHQQESGGKKTKFCFF